MNRDAFPSEDNLPRQPVALLELIRAAQACKLSFRYVNVLRHRLMDAVYADIEQEAQYER